MPIRSFRALVFAILFVVALPLRSEQVLISEIMYYPRGADTEYIEISNNTATPLDMARWRVSDAVTYEFPDFNPANPQASFLKPFERIVLSPADEATTRAKYNIGSSIRIFGPWSGNLSNARERITLLDKNGVILCSVEYNDPEVWSPAADGAGHSLVLKRPNRTVDDWRNWSASASPGGTPGTEPILAAETPVPNPEVDLSQGLAVVNFGDVWKYNDESIDLGDAWIAPGYNDSAWPEGPGLFGFENASLPAPGIRTPFNGAGQLTYYLRKKFVYTGSTQNANVTIDQIVDDGAIYYLNGTEIGRSGMAGGDAGFETTANRTVGDATTELDVFPVNPALLTSGENTLAVGVHQVNRGSSDLVFGMQLKIAVPAASQSGVVINEVLPGVPGAGFVEFYNASSTAVNLNGFYISDNPTNLRKTRISNDVIVPAGGLASIGFAENGLVLADVINVYLVAANGTSIENGISTSIPLDGRSLGRKPAGGTSWFLFTAPTRDQANMSPESLAGLLKLNEIHFGAANAVDWVEVFNTSNANVPLDGLFLSARRDLSDRQPLDGALNGRAFRSWNTAFPLDNGEVTLYLVNANGTVLDARSFSRVSGRDSMQAFPNGAQDWFASPTASRDSSNNPARQTDIVINEIMYDPPSDQLDGEFIELYNRGSVAIDVSGWRFSHGPNFTLPPGTIIPSGGYLVCAANATRIQSVYGNVAVIGDFQGRLANRGELVRLVDQFGNPVDAVDYSFGGDWPELTHGSGSSLELANPWLDNSLPSAWRDSDESSKAPFKTYTVTDTYRQINSIGGPSDYKELDLHLANDGYAILRNITLQLNGTGPNLIPNATVQSTSGSGADGWLCQGTHAASFVSNGQLHLMADGHGDNRANRAEIDVPGLTANSSVTLSFEARWVHGSPRVIAQTWDHSVGYAFRLEVPENLGTPGAVNSRYEATLPPQIDALRHQPAVPRPSEDVRITAHVLNAPASVMLFHRADNANANGTWLNKPMFDDGVNGGDEAAADGIYSALLTEHKVNGRIVQFYVRASGENNTSYHLPKWGEARPAMYVVDDRTIGRDLRTSRFIISAYDVDAISNGDTAKHRYRYPRLSNHYKNMTFISNEEEIHYGGYIRNSGSPWTRGGDLSRGKWKLPEDRKFRGHVKFTFDNDPTAGRMHHNRITRYMLYLLGHPGNENEFVRVIVNSGSPALREETEPVAKDMMDRLFENGRQGELYRIDDEWWFTDNWDRRDRNADWSYKNSENPVRYHTEWMKRTVEDDYDYSSLINLFQTVSTTPYTQEQIERIVDAEAVLSMAAVRGYIGDWDSFTLNRGKNGYMYRRWDDGKFMFLHWDSDLAFQNSNETLYNSGRPGIGAYIGKPYNLRRFYYYLTELIDNYTLNSPRMNAWLQAEEAASASYSVASGFYRNWFADRLDYCRTRMGTGYSRPFEISTNGGQPISTSGHEVALTGLSPYTVYTVEVEDHPEAEASWSSLDGWSVTGIRLREGANALKVRGIDQWGTVLQQDTVMFNKTGNAPPLAVLEADPRSWNLSVDQALQLDARASFDPEATHLTYSWNVAPAVAGFDTNQPGRATATFLHPGIYSFTLQATDAAGAATSAIAEAAVYGAGGFTSFSEVRLEPAWTLENVDYRLNDSRGPWLSLSDAPEWLTLQVLDTLAQPFTAPSQSYPRISRTLPGSGDWALQTKLRLASRQFGDFLTGLYVDTTETGAAHRYLFGIENGNSLAVIRLDSTGRPLVLATRALDVEEVEVRIRRLGDTLVFAVRENKAWISIATQPVAVSAVALRGGIFLSTAVPQSHRVLFDYALLIDPAGSSQLSQNLRVSEIMYHPVGGEEFEYIELINIGTTALDLTAARFTEGIEFTFGPTMLGAGERIVVVSDRAAFTARYGTGINMAAGTYSGRLSNQGEQLTLVDAAGARVLSVTYGTDGDWPEQADGIGSSLEVANLRGDFNDPDNWNSSREYLGSPGKAGIGTMTSVVINEVLTHSEAPLENAIELHNPTSATVDVSGWFLSDDAGRLSAFRIPAGTVVPAGGYRVFFESEFNDSADPLIHPFKLHGSQPGELWLTAADVTGNVITFIDHVEFPASENGVSFGRYPNGTGRLVPMRQRSFGRDNPSSLVEFRQSQGAPNSDPKVGPVVFSQIMYHPAGGNDEFLELMNSSAADVQLFDPARPGNTYRLGDGVEFSFPPNTVLRPGERVLVVAMDPAAFRSKYSVAPNVQVFGPYRGALDNAGEALELYKPDPFPASGTGSLEVVPYILVERVRYDNRAPWPVLADGLGPALLRRNLAAYGDDPGNWITDFDEDGMADDWETSYQLDPFFAADATLDPDNDGFNNRLEYQNGTNPRVAGGVIEVLSPRLAAETFTFEFRANANQAFTILYADDLAGSVWIKLRDVPAEGLARIVSISDPVSATGRARFYRVLVVQP